MATSNFRQYAPPPRQDMEYLANPLSSIQQPMQLGNGISENWANRLMPAEMPTRNLTNITSPGQPVNKPFDLSGFDKLGKGGTNASPKIWEQGGVGSLLKSKLGGKSLSSALAKKGGILGKIGKAGSSSPTPWMLGGTAAGILGDFIAKKKAKTGGAIGGAGKGAATGAMIGSAVPVIGTAIGGIAGGLIGGIKGFFGGKKKLKEKKAAEAAAKAGQAPGLTAIGGNGNKYGQNPSGALGRVVGSDPYGQLRAETEARYRPLDTPYTPFMPMPMLGGTQPFKVSTNPWDGGGDALGGQSTYGG